MTVSQARSHAIVDSQSVKSAAMVSQAVGYDAGKNVKGRKRFITVDTLGLVLRVLITAASEGEREGGKQVLKKVKQMEPSVSRLHTIWFDAGYNGNPFMQWVMDFCHWIVLVVIRPKERKEFVLLPKRWVVEQTLGWLTWCRRLNKDYELLPPNRRDICLYCLDSDYDEAIGVKSYSPQLFKHPLNCLCCKNRENGHTFDLRLVLRFIPPLKDIET